MAQTTRPPQASTYGPPVDRVASSRARPRSALFVAITGVMIAMVLVGFWPYFRNIGSNAPERPWLIHVHAAVYSGWMVLLLTQVVLVWRRRSDLHRRLGPFGIAYGVGVLVLGLVATIVAPLAHVASGAWSLDRAASFLILPIGDMLLFGGFFAAGVIYRRKPEIHKRCMLLATIALMFAPAARFAGDWGPAAILGVWLIPLVIAMGHDLWTRRRIHPAYGIGTAALLLIFTRVLVMESPEWIRVGRAIMMAFGATPGS